MNERQKGKQWCIHLAEFPKGNCHCFFLYTFSWLVPSSTKHTYTCTHVHTHNLSPSYGGFVPFTHLTHSREMSALNLFWGSFQFLSAIKSVKQIIFSGSDEGHKGAFSVWELCSPNLTAVRCDAEKRVTTGKQSNEGYKHTTQGCSIKLSMSSWVESVFI